MKTNIVTFHSGSIDLGRVLDKLKEDLESIVDTPKLIHGESFMMGTMDDWAEVLPDFKLYLHHQFNEKNAEKG